jgi:hypothetical protein
MKTKNILLLAMPFLFIGCATIESPVPCDTSKKMYFNKGEQVCKPFNARKLGVVTSYTCEAAVSYNGNCDEQKLEVSLEDGSVTELLMGSGSYKVGDKIEVIVE